MAPLVGAGVVLQPRRRPMIAATLGLLSAQIGQWGRGQRHSRHFDG
jgi:hypothetical protein